MLGHRRMPRQAVSSVPFDLQRGVRPLAGRWFSPSAWEMVAKPIGPHNGEHASGADTVPARGRTGPVGAVEPGGRPRRYLPNGADLPSCNARRLGLAAE